MSLNFGVRFLSALTLLKVGDLGVSLTDAYLRPRCMKTSNYQIIRAAVGFKSAKRSNKNLKYSR